MSAFPFDLVERPPALGLIVLRSDETLEPELHRLFPPGGPVLHVARIPSAPEVTPETLTQMERALPQAAGLLPEGARFSAVGYGCTSASTLIGAGRVAELVGSACQTDRVTDPLTAAIAAFRALKIGSIGLVTPYIESVAGPVRAAFEAAGFTVAKTLSFGEETEARVARIAPASVANAAREVAKAPGVEAVFLSCTNLMTFDVITPLEAELGRPVISSNLALGWHMSRGFEGVQPLGRLFEA